MAGSDERIFIGLDFGTESVRVVAADARGRTIASAVEPYRHGQIVPGSTAAKELFEHPLPTSFALQHPHDWIESASKASRDVSSRIPAGSVAAIAVDFTSCTMLPCRADGTPVCLERLDVSEDRTPRLREGLCSDPHAWPKLWKHHGAVGQTARMNEIARARGEPWLQRYGGVIGLEWLLPKVLEVIENSPEVADQTDIWLEAGDWFVWQLVGAPSAGGEVTAERLARSTCQAGYKALWSESTGYPGADYLDAVHPELALTVAQKLPGVFVAPGRAAGALCPAMAERLGLDAGLPVSAAIIDAHAGVPGAGVGRAGTLVMVMGTSGCHMLLSEVDRPVAGVAGIVPDGILPGFVGYETGQAAMGDAFDLARRLTGGDFHSLEHAASEIAPGSDGVLCLDWFNGCRTPIMDGSLRGAFCGLSLDHGPGHLYRATLEASAMGLRWIVDTLREGGVPVDAFVATGGLPRKSELFMHIVASALGSPVVIHPAAHGSAQGAAILAALAAGSDGGGFDDPGEAVESMAGARSALGPGRVVEPDARWTSAYEACYERYRRFAAALAQERFA